jgi:hypothetical protein
MKPIIFSGSMIRAILDGRKTMTRRPLKPQPPKDVIEVFVWFAPSIPPEVKAEEGCYYRNERGLIFHSKCPYGIPGDRLWVKETWALAKRYDKYPGSKVPKKGREKIWYLADSPKPSWCGRTRSSRFMPYWAHRIDLENENIRIEIVQEITEKDAKKEGMYASKTVQMGDGSDCFTLPFQIKWENLYGIDNPNAWERNPWVWVIEFKSK